MLGSETDSRYTQVQCYSALRGPAQNFSNPNNGNTTCFLGSRNAQNVSANHISIICPCASLQANVGCFLYAMVGLLCVYDIALLVPDLNVYPLVDDNWDPLVYPDPARNGIGVSSQWGSLDFLPSWTGALHGPIMASCQFFSQAPCDSNSDPISVKNPRPYITFY